MKGKAGCGPKMATGGSFRKVADGIAKKGKTKAKMPKMKGDSIGGGGKMGSHKK
ncbi:MAG: hypothetical protein DDT25_00121 [Chloroflexi bacterium]|nr:hypothetical protein [Chloroflexota bacterium]